MIIDVTADTGATAPAHIARPYRSGIGAPPLLNEVFHALAPFGKQTSTGPIQLGRSNIYMFLNVDEPSVISVPPPASFEEQIARTQSAVKSIDRIKIDLGLSITQLAEVFGVTRKTVYDWYDGAAPRAAVISRTHLLQSVIAAAPSHFDMTRLKLAWKMDGEGRSFLAILNDDGLNEATTKAALVEKLNELSSRLVSASTQKVRSTMGLGDAHLSHIDRHAQVG